LHDLYGDNLEVNQV